ncbi:hypothetical protein IGI04_008100 [Brassica rapa subsp. trilocularis]|uniref:Uncharacterized protein n=1 Tax=Brassica rapa subsp. trilocularis TaxID=1813537 RepID=A0ABQ7NLN3_BRACM|nr:hypothetical protein IGI04_008100 [Brassica rapa subsp. trilocularis]
MNGKGNTYNSAKKIDVLKPQTCVPRNFLGIFRGNSEEPYKFIEIHAHDILFPRINENIPRKFRRIFFFRRNFLGIFSFNRANKPPNISRKLKLKILRKFRRKISCIPRDIPTTSSSEYSDDFPTNLFSSEFPRKFISSEFRRKFPRDFRGKMNFRGVISEDFFRRYVVGIALFRRHTDDFFPQYVAVFL